MKNKTLIRTFFLVFLLFPSMVIAQPLRVEELMCEYAHNPAGIETQSPKLSWILISDQRNVRQTAYRILVANNPAELQKNNGNIWDSKKVISSASIQVVYMGQKLQSAKTYYWKVMVWDNHKHFSQSGSLSKWQMGLLKPEDWHGAKWIAYAQMPDSMRIVPFAGNRGPKGLPPVNDVLPLFRKTFLVNKPVKRATVYVCGLGHFDMSLNGEKVGDHFLDPGWTQYSKQALYVPFDVTDKILQGENSLGAMLGNGFYFIPRDKRYRKMTGAYDFPKMICRVLIQYQDGSEQNIVSNEDWKTSAGPITFSSIYGGEDYNANLEQSGWNKRNFNDDTWRKVVIVNGPPQLNAQAADPVKVMQEFSPVSKTHLSTGAWVYDLGQNASGIPEITVQGKKGDTVRIFPAELVHPDGNINQSGSGKPYYLDYVLKGNGSETWHPQFTYYGFRYLQVEGAVPDHESNISKLPILLSIKGMHTRNSANNVGNFNCSFDLFNRTFKLIDWAIKSNMASVFTDCPHREKLGWLEEAHLVGNSLHYNYDIHRLALKCINDMRLAQTPEGLVPEIAPEFTKFGEPFRDSPEWGSNCIILPWYVYQWYGDKNVLADNYDMMTRYINYLNSKADNFILTQGLGDWYDQGPKAPGFSQQTPKGITATAFYYYDLMIAAHIAEILGRSKDALEDRQLASKIKKSYNASFFNQQNKEYGTGSQTANAISVYMGLVEPQFKSYVIDNIVKDLRERGNSLTSGDIGFRYLLKVLNEAGRADVIYAMNSRTDVPGYGYQLAHGATALTESWAGLPAVSNNHFMLGDIMEWFYEGVGGILPSRNSVAMNEIEIKPEPVENMKYAATTYHSPYGVIGTNWKNRKDKFELTVTIPVNTQAVVYLPASGKDKITEGGNSINDNGQIKLLGFSGGKAVIRIHSGTYHFISGK